MTTNTSALSEITRLWWNREGVGESRGSIHSTGSIPISITKTLLSPSKFPELFKLSAKEPRTKARQIMYTTMVYWPQGTKQCITCCLVLLDTFSFVKYDRDVILGYIRVIKVTDYNQIWTCYLLLLLWSIDAIPLITIQGMCVLRSIQSHVFHKKYDPINNWNLMLLFFCAELNNFLWGLW